MRNDDHVYIADMIIAVKNSFLYLLSKWLIIFIFCFVAGLLGILYAWLKEPSYTAELTFSSETSNESSFGGYAGIAAQLGFDLGGGNSGAFEGDNLMELLKSKSMVTKTLLSDAKNFGNKLMIDAYLENHQLNKDWKKDPKMGNIHFEKNLVSPDRRRDSVLKAVVATIIDDQLSIYKIDKKLNFIMVSMKDRNEVYAKEFVEALMQNASDFYISYKSKKAKSNFDLVNKMTDSIKGLLYGNIESYASSTDLNINPIRQQVKTGSQKIQINAQANTALYTELLQQLGLSKISLQRETPLIQIIDEPVLPLKKDKPGRLLTGIMFSLIGFFLFSFCIILSRWVKTELVLSNHEFRTV